jgi:hypothetical protein
MWTDAELRADSDEARGRLRERRKAEELEKRLLVERNADRYSALLRELLEATDDLRSLPQKPDVLESREIVDMARYIALPFISLGDLDTMTDSCFDTWVKQKTERGQRPTAAGFAAAAEYLHREADPFRAPWLDQIRAPTAAEREHFIRGTIAVRFVSILQTRRRNEGSKRQETAVRMALQEAGYAQVTTSQNIVDPLDEMPERTFVKNARSLRNTSIDVPVRLPDDHPTGIRFVAFEAKDTNTDVNSRKRLLDVTAKAATWNASGLPYQIRTAAVVSGSLPFDRLKQAQDHGVMLFWEHRLDDLVDFLSG